MNAPRNTRYRYLETHKIAGSLGAEVSGVDLSEDLPDDYKTCIYRVVQEALHNCSRHSNATTIRVRVQQKAGVLLLSIQDDGKGFDVSQSKGLGLLGIEERVAQLGGTCQVHSGPGIGTILTVELPFHPPDGQLKKDQSEADSHPVSG